MINPNNIKIFVATSQKMHDFLITKANPLIKVMNLSFSVLIITLTYLLHGAESFLRS